jgi:cytochrome b561
MRRGLADGLFWMAIVFVAASFLLGFAGAEMSSGPVSELILQWHKAFGLLSLIVWLGAVVAYAFGKRRFSTPLRFWALRFRSTVLAILYALLIVQPLSGWLLASLKGELTSILGWQLPPLAAPNGQLAEYVLTYHVLGAGLILIIAAWSLRLTWDAYALGALARLRRRQLARAAAQARADHGRRPKAR